LEFIFDRIKLITGGVLAQPLRKIKFISTALN